MSVNFTSLSAMDECKTYTYGKLSPADCKVYQWMSINFTVDEYKLYQWMSINFTAFRYHRVA